MRKTPADQFNRDSKLKSNTATEDKHNYGMGLSFSPFMIKLKYKSKEYMFTKIATLRFRGKFPDAESLMSDSVLALTSILHSGQTFECSQSCKAMYRRLANGHKNCYLMSNIAFSKVLSSILCLS